MALDIISAIDLDLKSPNAEIVYANQYDSVGRIKAQLLNDGSKWEVPAGAVAAIAYRKSDRIGGYYDTTEFGETAVSISSDRSIITIVLDAQTMTTFGPVYMQINFLQNDRRLSTFEFLLQVKKSPTVQTNIESKWFVHLLSLSGIVVDDTLTLSGRAADAKKTGDLLAEISSDLDSEIHRATYAEDSKINKPITNPFGQEGQVLQTNGDGTTLWKDVARPSDQQVEEAVSDWLDAHPEKTTTVTDHSISEIKLTESLMAAIDTSKSKTVFGSYIGDIYNDSNYIPASIAKAGDKIYILSNLKESVAIQTSSNNAQLTIVDLETGLIENERMITGAHANSLAYDIVNEKFYVASPFRYDGGAQDANYDIWEYASDFNSYRTIACQTTTMGVSYDPTTSTLYRFDYHKNLYKYENDSFDVFVTHLDVPLEKYDLYNQDVAIYNDTIFLSSPRGDVLISHINHVDDSEIANMIFVARYDNKFRFMIGELEGWEFSDAGKLYAITYTPFSDNVSYSGIVLNIPTQFSDLDMSIYNSYGRVSTAIINEDSQRTFETRSDRLKSLNQISIMPFPPSDVYIYNATEKSSVKIDRPVNIHLWGEYVVPQLNIFETIATINGESGHIDGGPRMTLSNNFPIVVRNSIFNINGDTINMNIPAGRSLIYDGGFPSIITCGRNYPLANGVQTSINASDRLIRNGQFIYTIQSRFLDIYNLSLDMIETGLPSDVIENGSCTFNRSNDNIWTFIVDLRCTSDSISYTLTGAIPQLARPSRDISFLVGDGTIGGISTVRLRPSGDINLYPGSGRHVSGTIMYKK